MADIIKVGIVDDHALFRSAIQRIIDSFDGYKVTLEAENGADMTEKLKGISKDKKPDVLYLDINMPIMDGFDTVKWLKKHLPDIKIIVLTMHLSEDFIVKMIKLGVNSYLTKNCSTEELSIALERVITHGSYYPQEIVDKVFQIIRDKPALTSTQEATLIQNIWNNLTGREKEVHHHICTSELKYNDIAEKLMLSPRAVETIRVQLFEKFGVKTRVGLVIQAIKGNIYQEYSEKVN